MAPKQGKGRGARGPGGGGPNGAAAPPYVGSPGGGSAPPAPAETAGHGAAGQSYAAAPDEADRPKLPPKGAGKLAKGRDDAPDRRRRRRRPGKGGKGGGLQGKGPGGKGGDDSDDEDLQHFADVCFSMLWYQDDAKTELQFIEDSYKRLKDPHDKELLLNASTSMALLQDMQRCVAENAKFLRMLVESDEDAFKMGFAKIPNGHQVQERNSVKVRTVLRQFVRDWAEEGAEERDGQYGTLLRALQRYIPLGGPGVERPRVLTPGSGLARLPFEAARLGYNAQGNEFSYHMLQGSKWVLNETSMPNAHCIYPFVLGMEHRRGQRDHLRGVKVPDVCPSEELCPQGRPIAELSMCAGEFVEVYQDQVREWDAVLTCFFLDTAKNVFLYIRVIANIIRPGGLWANIGPLLYHYAEQPTAISIELSWEEIKPAIEKYFEFKEEEEREAYYTTNVQGMFHTRYRCKYFAAIRNSVPAEGSSHPVF